MHFAAQRGHLKVAQLLLQYGADVNKLDYGGTPLHAAIAWNHIEMIELLLENGANVNQPNYRGETPIVFTRNYPEIIRLLLQHGADINSTDMDGFTPLYIASMKGYKETVELFYDAKLLMFVDTDEEDFESTRDDLHLKIIVSKNKFSGFKGIIDMTFYRSLSKIKEETEHSLFD